MVPLGDVERRDYTRGLRRPTPALLALCVVSPALWTAPDLDQPVAWIFYVCVWICTPLLFNLTRASKLDNALGQLSYPIYLSHVLVIDVVGGLDLGRVDKGLVATVVTIVLSTALYIVVDRPIERIRRRLGSAHAATGVPRTAAMIQAAG